MRSRVVSIIGSAHCSQDQARLAERVGALLAEKEVIIVCGGRGGVMQAACKGAAEAGGFTVGLLPGNDPSEGNAYLTIAIPTGLGETRNSLVARAGQAVIAIGGGEGTLAEIAFAIKAGIRVIGLDTWTAEDHSGRELPISQAGTAEEAVEMALSESARE